MYYSENCNAFVLRILMETSIKRRVTSRRPLMVKKENFCICMWWGFIFKGINAFIEQGHCVKLIKNYSTDIYNFRDFMVSTKIFQHFNIFNIDNNQKCFLSSKAAYYYDFWRSCDTEDWSNDAENSFDHRNKLQFNTYSHRKQLFYIVIIFQIFTVFIVFLIRSKYSLLLYYCIVLYCIVLLLLYCLIERNEIHF